MLVGLCRHGPHVLVIELRIQNILKNKIFKKKS